jgi:hypothetical protein
MNVTHRKQLLEILREANPYCITGREPRWPPKMGNETPSDTVCIRLTIHDLNEVIRVVGGKK